MDIKKQILVALGLDKEEVALEYQAKLVDGTIIASTSPALEEGISINVISEDGTQMAIPEGEYETEDGDSFTVEEEGIVATVTKGEPKEEEAEEDEEIEKEEDKEEMENLEPVDERLPKKIKESTEIEFEIVEKVTEVMKEALSEVNSKIEKLSKEVSDLKGNKEELEKDKAELLSKVEKLEKEPATEPVNTNKFAREVKELTSAQYRGLTRKEKLLYNLNKIK